MNDDNFRTDNHVTSMNFRGIRASDREHDHKLYEICELEFENSVYETLFSLRYPEYVE